MFNAPKTENGSGPVFLEYGTFRKNIAKPIYLLFSCGGDIDNLRCFEKIEPVKIFWEHLKQYIY